MKTLKWWRPLVGCSIQTGAYLVQLKPECRLSSPKGQFARGCVRISTSKCAGTTPPSPHSTRTRVSWNKSITNDCVCTRHYYVIKRSIVRQFFGNYYFDKDPVDEGNPPECFVFSGETLLSPLVMCGPHGLQFEHPVELRLPHCE